nr:hypothetical protein [Polaromonas sp. YR568]
MPRLISKILRFFLKLVLGIFAAVFALSLLAAALIVVVLSVLKSLITGRKPAPAMVFGRFQRYSPQGMWPGGPAQGNAANQRAGDVVDVEVREVRDDKRLP